MAEPKCKFCGKELAYKYSDYDKYYFCDCDGQAHFKQLQDELSKLQSDVVLKTKEITDHVNQSQYAIKKAKLLQSIQNLDLYYDDADI